MVASSPTESIPFTLKFSHEDQKALVFITHFHLQALQDSATTNSISIWFIGFTIIRTGYHIDSQNRPVIEGYGICLCTLYKETRKARLLEGRESDE